MSKDSKSIKHRFLAFMLALVIIVGVMPLNVIAEQIDNGKDNVESDVIINNEDSSDVRLKEENNTDVDKDESARKCVVTFNSNGGGGGAVQPITLKESDSFELPKNVFKAPEGNVFKNWIVDGKEFDEGYELVVTKDIEVKAYWEDVKVNPVKKALNSLLGKDKEELDISDELVGEAVTSDGEYTAPAHNSVVSSDGKVQIRNFEVFWTSTDGDAIVDTRGWKNGWYSPHKDAQMTSTFNNEPKTQINWALSGEVQYPKGAMTITIPDMQFENEKDLKYPLKGYSIPELKFKEDGSIDFDANYGNATLAYYYDKDEGAYKITNILELAPGASGTFTLTYDKYAGNSRWLKDMSIHETTPVIDLKYKDEILETQDKALKIQQDTKLAAAVGKSGTLFKTWQDDWGNELKPENVEDYWYVCYEVRAFIKDYLQTNCNIKLTDNIGDIYEYNFEVSNPNYYEKNFKRKISEQEIIGYADLTNKGYSYTLSSYDKEKGIEAPPFKNMPKSENKIEWNKNIKIEENEIKEDKFSNKNVYKNSYDLNLSCYYAYVLTKIPAKKLGYIDEKKSHHISIVNNVDLETTPLNSEDSKINGDGITVVNDNYTYYPPVDFTAPPGNQFSISKESLGIRYKPYYNDYNKDRENESWDTSYNAYFEYKDSYRAYSVLDDLESERAIEWKINTSSRVASETYDESYGEKNNPDAYGKKKVRHEIVDDYLYLGDDYQKELTSDDYNVTGVWLGVNFLKYKQKSTTTKAEYMPELGESPASLYLRKESTGEWVKAVEFNVKSSSGDSRDYPYAYIKNTVTNVNKLIDGIDVKMLWGKRRFKTDKYSYMPYISVPKGYTSVKLVVESNFGGLDTMLFVDGVLKPSKRVMDYIKTTADDDYVMKALLKNDPTFAAYNEEGNRIGLQGTTKSHTAVDRTLGLDRQNYEEEMYHTPSYITLVQKKIPEIKREQNLYKTINYNDDNNQKQETFNNTKEKLYEIPCQVEFSEVINNAAYSKKNATNLFHIQNSGTFYDLLPLGVTGVKDVEIIASQEYNNNYDKYKKYSHIDKDTGTNTLKSSYELVPNWMGSGRTMLIAKFDNAIMNSNIKSKIGCTDYAELYLNYKMIYPWDSYKDYGSKIERNLVAYESGFEKRPDDGLDDDLTSELESGFKDDPIDAKDDWSRKTFTDQEDEWMKDLNPNHDEKRFLYAEASTTVSGDTEANVGLTKHVSTDINPNFTLKSTAKEGGNYQYKIRLQAAHGTSVSNLIFFDSIENYDPLKADADYGVKQWRGTLSSIGLNHPIMKGINPKVYVSTKPKLDIEKHNDVTDSSVWTLYKEGDDLSNVQAIAIDLSKNKDGSDFKLAQDTAINVYLNMKAPWNLKEKQIDPEAKALNSIYASNTVTTNLDNKSTKLIYTAYTAVDLKPVTAETQIKATKKYIDKEGKNIALKGDDFTFELKDDKGNTLQTKTNDNKGNITFDPIKYNSWDVGEHNYKIVEVKGNNTKIAYDSHEEIAKVKVERVGDSKLKATVIYDDDGPNFLNQDKKSASLKIIKKDAGTGKLLEGAEYLLNKKNDDSFKPVKLITNSNGESQIVEDLETGTYILKEINAPQNYRLDTEGIEFEITDNDLGTVVVKEVEDNPKADMPTTGTVGKVYFAIAMNLVALAGIDLYRRKKLKNN